MSNLPNYLINLGTWFVVFIIVLVIYIYTDWAPTVLIVAMSLSGLLAVVYAGLAGFEYYKAGSPLGLVYSALTTNE
jgi:hypothetical protein